MATTTVTDFNPITFNNKKAALEKEARAAGYAMAESEQVDEGRMAEASMLIYDLISGER